MTAERKKVLEMLAEGKISAEEAERLLDKLAAGAAGGSASEAGSREEAGPASQTGKPRFLRIAVDGPERERVNLRVPLNFMRAGVKLLGVVPLRVAQKLAEKGIDLSAFAEIKGENLVEALQQLNLDVDAGDGKKVRIFCE